MPATQRQTLLNNLARDDDHRYYIGLMLFYSVFEVFPMGMLLRALWRWTPMNSNGGFDAGSSHVSSSHLLP